MTARIRKLLYDLSGAFWLIPALMVFVGVLAAIGLVGLDTAGLVPQSLINSPFLYNGGATGARTMLGAVAASTIGVAGTVFSITIASLSLATGQMGPRLLHNFTRDRANQVTLGIFLGTFSYTLMVLRSVRAPSEGEFVPHLSLSIGILLAFVCVATLVLFVDHMANRINVDTVIELVSKDVFSSVQRLTTTDEPPPTPPAASWQDAVPVVDDRRGYLQQLDQSGLADWAAEHKTAIRLLIRPGEYVFPGAPIALVVPPVDGAADAIRRATALGPQRAGSVDLEFAVDQLVEVAVRALSPGINDPHTAISVLNRLGAALCDVARLHLPAGVWFRGGRLCLVVPSVDYDGLVNSMFHMIRQNATNNPAVLIRLLEVLTAVLGCESDRRRVKTLQRHADLTIGDAEHSVRNRADLDDLRQRYDRFIAVSRQDVRALIHDFSGIGRDDCRAGS